MLRIKNKILYTDREGQEVEVGDSMSERTKKENLCF